MKSAFPDAVKAPQTITDPSPNGLLSRRPGFNPRLRHTKDFKNGT